MTASFLPPNPPEQLRPLDLAQQKGVGALLTSAWRIWKARPGIFLATSLVVGAVPLAIFTIAQDLIIRSMSDDARWERVAETGEFASGDLEALASVGALFFVSIIVTGLIVPAIVTATHARAVVALASGDDLTRQEALRRGLTVLGPVVWATFLWAVATIIGLFLFVIPGLYIGLAGSFGPMLVALSLGKGWGAVRESMRLVRAAGWWRTFGAVFVINLVAAVVLLVPSGIFSAIAGAVDTTAATVINSIIQGVLTALAVSWSALATTLIFFSWKSRIGEGWVRPAGTAAVDIPGGGGDAPAHPSGQWGPPAGQQGGGLWGDASQQQGAQSPAPPTGPTFVRPGDLRRQQPGGDDEPPHFQPPGR